LTVESEPLLAAPESPGSSKRYSRRLFSKKALLGLGAMATAVGYPFAEACWLRVVRVSIPVPRLPDSFRGLRIAFLADLHHGPVTGLGFIRRAVELANSLDADLIALGGDYVLAHKRFIRPCFSVLTELKAPLGVCAVLGNHDHWQDAVETHQAIKDSGFTDLTNTGKWLERGGARLRIAGVGDLWEDRQDLGSALGDTSDREACILLSHNPDYTELVEDTRVGLILSGHTHGGQVVLPILGAPIVPSGFGQKYLSGLVKTECTQVFVTRGAATIYPPVRLCCPPEVVLVTLEGPGNL
jgi:predicted MPP superfamily phosphohydrolase